MAKRYPVSDMQDYAFNLCGIGLSKEYISIKENKAHIN